MPAVGNEIKATYEVTHGKGKPHNGRVITVLHDDEKLGEIDVPPQLILLWGLSGLDSNTFALFVLLNERKEIVTYRFERRAQV